MSAVSPTRRHALAAFLASGLIAMPGRLAAARGTSLSEELASAIVSARATPLTAEVAQRTAWTLLDCVAAMVHGASQGSIQREVGVFANRVGLPAASVLGRTKMIAVEQAAAANAFLLHAEEVDDSDLFSQLRASAVIMPVALAIAEIQDLTGKQFLEAAAMGYTVQRLLAAPLGATQRFGWMASGVWGPPAAAAMAAAAMGLPARTIADAIALAGSGSGGSFQYFYDQTEEKRLIVARGARLAIESARLAASGHVGARHILEGRAGLYSLFGGTSAKPPTVAELTDRLDASEGPLFLYPKYYSASASIIPSLDGLARDLPKDIGLGQIKSFTVRGDADWANVLADKINRFTPPETRLGAMTNFSFMLALFVQRRSALPVDVTPAALGDSKILALARTGRFVTAPLPELTIEFRMNDGTTLTTIARTPELHKPAPLDADRRTAKYDALTGPLLSVAAQSRLRSACLSVGEVRSMRRWATNIRRLDIQGK